MLKSMFKNNFHFENNINRKATKKNIESQFMILFIVIILLSGILIFYKSNQYKSGLKKIFDKTNSLLVNYGFHLQNIYIIGEKNIQKNIILNSIEPKKYKNIFDVNLIKIHNNLLLNEWIETVQVKRILPNSIKIQITEKKPLAIWQTKLGNKLITKDGSVISIANPNIFKNKLPIIIGEKVNKNAHLIIQILKQIPDLYNNIWSISYINKRRWNVHLKQGLTVLLPKKNIYNAWEKIHFLQKEYRILDLGLIEIDVRNQSQIFGKLDFDKSLYLKRKEL